MISTTVSEIAEIADGVTQRSVSGCSSQRLGVLGSARDTENCHGAMHPYQRKAWRFASKELQDNRYVQVVSLPTGSGKTVVATALAVDHLDRHPNGQVVWLAPRWEILRQTYLALRKWFPNAGFTCGRAGGSSLDIDIPDDAAAHLIFTTMSTWNGRHCDHDGWTAANENQLVVLDESHWAQDAQLGKTVRDNYLGTSAVLGLSATPRKTDDQRDRIVYQQSYADLCPRDDAGNRYLAQPKILTVPTGQVWDPIFRTGSIAEESLRELAAVRDRNALVTATVVAGLKRRDFTRAIVFACNIQHADTLRELLRADGVSTESIHSGRPAAQKRVALQKFREGRVEVVVTVTELAVGLDVPQVDGIVLARPSGSLILLAQMIGRGARLDQSSGKESFWIVEFEDKLRDRSKQIFRAGDYLAESVAETRTWQGQRRPARSTWPDRHDEPLGPPHFEQYELPGLPPLPFVEGQTFGVEIELGLTQNRDRARAIARQILNDLRSGASRPVDTQLRHYGYGNHSRWRVTLDDSCGLEVVSPILVGHDGFRELKVIGEILTESVRNCPDLRVDHRCGLHLTLATRLNTESRRRAFLARLARLEPGLFTLVAPSRLYRFDGYDYDRRRRSQYCAPVGDLIALYGSGVLDRPWLFSRYRSVNMTKSRDDLNLLEVRMHNGTTDYKKILPWISLWMTIFNHDRYRWRGDLIDEKVFRCGDQRIIPSRADREDIFQLLFEEGIAIEQSFADLLYDRRAALRRFWRRVIPRRVSGWERAGFYSRPS